MKFVFVFISLICLLTTNGAGQLEPYGLDTLKVTDLRFYAGDLYASTEDYGVFKRSISDTNWISLGLEGKNLRTIYPHQVGPLNYAVTVGIKPIQHEGDSTLVQCWYNQSWIITDSGMNHEDTWEIRSIDGIPTMAVCGETFAVGSGKVYRKKTTVWEKVFEGAVINVVRVSPNYEIWIGGETMIFWPFIAKSTDIGDTWTMMYPDLSGDNACNSIAFDPSDTNIIYAGMEGVVIKTTDGGVSWSRTGLTGMPFYMRGVAVDPINPSHLFAGGIAVPDSFGLFESTDAGETWKDIKPPTGTKGVSSIVFNPSGNHEIFISTYGSGVFLYKSPVVGIEEETRHPVNNVLYQNYPNPFNPTTKVSFVIGLHAEATQSGAQAGHSPARRSLPVQTSNAGGSFVTLKVYDILGREVATLVNERRSPGKYDIIFNGSNLPSGVYFYRLQTERYTNTKKLILMK